jgi:hypothetical protein
MQNPPQRLRALPDPLMDWLRAVALSLAAYACIVAVTLVVITASAKQLEQMECRP